MRVSDLFPQSVNSWPVSHASVSDMSLKVFTTLAPAEGSFISPNTHSLITHTLLKKTAPHTNKCILGEMHLYYHSFCPASLNSSLTLYWESFQHLFVSDIVLVVFVQCDQVLQLFSRCLLGLRLYLDGAAKRLIGNGGRERGRGGRITPQAH